MPKFLCNAPPPGSQLGDLRLVPPGMEFEVAIEDEPGGPRNMWIPVDASARQWLKDWNTAHPDPPNRPKGWVTMQRHPYALNRSHLPPHLREIPDPTASKVVKPAPSEEE